MDLKWWTISRISSKGKTKFAMKNLGLKRHKHLIALKRKHFSED